MTMRAMRMILMAVLLFGLCGTAVAEGPVGATVHVRASRDVRDSVIRVGEDVDLMVTLSGFEPESCLWYREGERIDGEARTSLRISGAQVSDTGVYRMDALDTDGRVRVSVEVSLRVVDGTIPQTGDDSLPRAIPLAMTGAAGGMAALLAGVRRRRLAMAGSI